jgi:hypothetical protein
MSEDPMLFVSHLASYLKRWFQALARAVTFSVGVYITPLRHVRYGLSIAERKHTLLTRCRAYEVLFPCF